MSNTFGKIFTLTSFGESHGAAVGGVIDGFPAGIDIDLAFIQSDLNRRKPGNAKVATARKEDDEVEILSGIFEGKSTGTPIGFLVRNTAQHSADYDHLKDLYRPSHADYTYEVKYGIRDHRGGGRSSARETIARVVAGAFAKLALKKYGTEIIAYTSRIGEIGLEPGFAGFEDLQDLVKSNLVNCPNPVIAAQMEEYLAQLKTDGDSAGGIVSCLLRNVPAGLGEPVFDKLHARLGSAMLSINAAKGFEYGLGFNFASRRGSEVNDEFIASPNSPSVGELLAQAKSPIEGGLRGAISTRTNFSGGIQGGISNGQDIYFRVAFKPIATIAKEQHTVNKSGEEITLAARGRHDPCVIPRVIVVVEAMAAVTLLDMILLARRCSCGTA
ncbi:MAG: chorismate synthase [Prevotellaceae bacterium]|jgi:chorismate synthase|nr:chorismate synthase [Prevotellaceae bacterium]